METSLISGKLNKEYRENNGAKRVDAGVDAGVYFCDSYMETSLISAFSI